jgi:hypothetical protein
VGRIAAGLYLAAAVAAAAALLIAWWQSIHMQTFMDPGHGHHRGGDGHHGGGQEH